MRILLLAAALLPLSACYGAPASSHPASTFYTTSYRFKANTRDPKVADETMAIMQARLKDADVFSASVARSGNLITVLVAHNLGLDIKHLLSARDVVQIRLLPNGPAYTAGGVKPFKRAFAIDAPQNGPTVSFVVANPAAFRRFMDDSVGRYMGFVVDGKLVQKIYIAGASFDNYGAGEIVGLFRMNEARTMAAQLEAGPLPVPVRPL